mgnify:CR=1 FL=1
MANKATNISVLQLTYNPYLKLFQIVISQEPGLLIFDYLLSENIQDNCIVGNLLHIHNL